MRRGPWWEVGDARIPLPVLACESLCRLDRLGKAFLRRVTLEQRVNMGLGAAEEDWAEVLQAEGTRCVGALRWEHREEREGAVGGG